MRQERVVDALRIAVKARKELPRWLTVAVLSLLQEAVDG